MSSLITQSARPKTLRDVAGQEVVKQALRSIVKSPETSPRVLILHGTYGIGKTSIARAFARAVNCKHPVDGDACGECEVCLSKIEDTQYYDEYDSSIIGNVEDIKRLREFFDYNSKDGYRIITIDEAHLISRQAQSALLKTFEEINSNVFFILCTTEKEKLLPTIISRSFDLKLNPISYNEMKDNLIKVAKENEIEITDDVVDMIIRKSEGHLRDAHMLLSNYKLLDKDNFRKLLTSARDVYLMYYISCYQGNLDNVYKCLDALLRFPLTDLKRDYESLILEIMECATGYIKPKDKLMDNLLKLVKSKAMNLYSILVDRVVIDSFESNNRFKAAQLDIYLKINDKII